MLPSHDGSTQPAFLSQLVADFQRSLHSRLLSVVHLVSTSSTTASPLAVHEWLQEQLLACLDAEKRYLLGSSPPLAPPPPHAASVEASAQSATPLQLSNALNELTLSAAEAMHAASKQTRRLQQHAQQQQQQRSGELARWEVDELGAEEEKESVAAAPLRHPTSTSTRRASLGRSQLRAHHHHHHGHAVEVSVRCLPHPPAAPASADSYPQSHSHDEDDESSFDVAPPDAYTHTASHSYLPSEALGAKRQREDSHNSTFRSASPPCCSPPGHPSFPSPELRPPHCTIPSLSPCSPCLDFSCLDPTPFSLCDDDPLCCFPSFAQQDDVGHATATPYSGQQSLSDGATLYANSGDTLCSTPLSSLCLPMPCDPCAATTVSNGATTTTTTTTLVSCVPCDDVNCVESDINAVSHNHSPVKPDEDDVQATPAPLTHTTSPSVANTDSSVVRVKQQQQQQQQPQPATLTTSPRSSIPSSVVMVSCHQCKLKKPSSQCMQCSCVEQKGGGGKKRCVKKYCNTCCTGDHMVLTSSGWKFIGRIERNDEVASLNIETACIEWKRVIEVQHFPIARQRLYRMQGSHMDIIATQDHRMLVAHMDGQGQLEEADSPIDYETVAQLLPPNQRYAVCRDNQLDQFAESRERSVLRSGINPQPHYRFVIANMEKVCDWWWEKDNQLGFLRLVGMWLGDGHLMLGRRRTVHIAQYELLSTAWLIELLDEVFPRWWYRIRKNDVDGVGYDHVICCPPLFEWLRVMAIGPAGYHPMNDVGYPHTAFDSRVEELEAPSEYRELPPATPRHYWKESAMLYAFNRGPRLRPCQVCGRTDGPRLFCRGPRCSHVDHITRICPRCANRPEDATAFDEPWSCLRCEDEHDTQRYFFCQGVREEEGDESTTCPVHGNHWRAVRPRGTAPAGDEGEPEQPMETEDERVVTAMAARQQHQPPYAYVPGSVIIPWSNGLWRVGDGNWFHLKRWMGPNVAGSFARMSQPQAVALLEGFHRADGQRSGIQFDTNGQPTGTWRATHSSFPLIHHLQLVGQLAGAAVELRLHTKAGTVTKIKGRDAQLRANHWALLFDFKPDCIPGVRTTPFARPTDVTNDADNVRGYHVYEDDGMVYDISVEGNHNFLAQRLGTRLTRGPRDSEDSGEGVRAYPVFIGNCLGKHYNFHMPVKAEGGEQQSQWICPACKQQCSCAACARRKLMDEEEANMVKAFHHHHTHAHVTIHSLPHHHHSHAQPGHSQPPPQLPSMRASCHQCKSSKSSLHLLACSSRRSIAADGKRLRDCKKKFCGQCLQRWYGLDMDEIKRKERDGGPGWRCPACEGTCPCAACRRKDGRTHEEGKEDEDETADGSDEDEEADRRRTKRGRLVHHHHMHAHNHLPHHHHHHAHEHAHQHPHSHAHPHHVLHHNHTHALPDASSPIPPLPSDTTAASPTSSAGADTSTPTAVSCRAEWEAA